MIAPKVRERIIELRKEGMSYSRIAWRCRVAKHTVQTVCRGIVPMGLCSKCGSPTGNAERCVNCALASSVGPEKIKEPAPTQTIPGTIERIDVYRQRIENGEAVFHSEDRNFDGLIGAVKPSSKEQRVVGNVRLAKMRPRVVRKGLGD